MANTISSGCGCQPDRHGQVNDLTATYDVDEVHHMSEARLSRYCAEFDFRYNHRKVNDTERADVALVGAAGKPLAFRRADAA